MLALLDETIPDAKTSSLCNPRNVKLIGTVQHLTSRPKKITLKLALNSLIYRGIKNIRKYEKTSKQTIVLPGNFSFHPQTFVAVAIFIPAGMAP